MKYNNFFYWWKKEEESKKFGNKEIDELFDERRKLEDYTIREEENSIIILTIL